MPREKFLTACAWAVHLYTALGAVAGLLSIMYTARGSFRAAFVAMGVAVVIDSSDGSIARALRVSQRIPGLDGALLDNLVDYLNYVVVPVFLMLKTGIIPRGTGGIMLAGFVLIASAYGFCQVEAKTQDHYFRGFPSYWNLVALYLFCLQFSPAANIAVLVVLGLLVFVPIKYIYPSRTELMRPVTLGLAGVWAIATTAMLPAVPNPNPVLLYTSLAFVVYYFVMSLVLHMHPTRAASHGTR